MVEEFFNKEQDMQCQLWLAQHLHGFYLNKRPKKGEWMLHKVGCSGMNPARGTAALKILRSPPMTVMNLRYGLKTIM